MVTFFELKFFHILGELAAVDPRFLKEFSFQEGGCVIIFLCYFSEWAQISVSHFVFISSPDSCSKIFSTTGYWIYVMVL